MALEADQAVWLNRFTGGMLPQALASGKPGDALAEQLRIARAKEEVAEQTLKEMLLARAAKAIEPEKQRMRDAFDMQVEVNGKAMPTRDKKGRQHKAFDTEETSQVTRGISEAEGTDSTRAMEVIVAQKLELEKVTVQRTSLDRRKACLVQQREKLFSKQEIMEELYTPLVRELILPENFVPRDYSATQKMIDGSNDYYIQECKAKGKEPDRGLAALAKGSIQLTTSVVSVIVGVEVDHASLADAANSSHAAIVEGVGALLGAGVDGITAAKDAYDNRKFDTATWNGIVGSVASSLGKMLGGVFDDIYKGDAYGQWIQTALGGVTAAVVFAKWAKNRDEAFPWDEFSGAVISGLSSGLAGASDLQSDPSLGLKLEIGSVVANASKILPGYAVKFKDFGKLTPEQRSKLICRLILEGMVEATKGAVDVDVTIENTFTTISQTEMDKNIVAGERVKDALDAALEGDLELLEDEEEGDEAKVTRQTKEIEDAQDLIAREKEDYINALDRLGDMRPDNAQDKDFKSIARLIEKIETDRKIMAAAAAVSAMPFAVAQEFFAPLKAAGALIKFMTNLHAAIERAVALRKWLDAHEDALTAVSPYATSIQNFVRNQGEQFAHYTIQAALRALEAASAVAETGYPPVKALTLAATASATLEDTIYQFVKQQKLRAAWKITKASLENTENRKLALIARKMNPTLAKYTIAYGAIVEKSPIATTAMNRCGLDRETLSREKDGVPKVKAYLETLYPDDGQALGPIAVKPGAKRVPQPALTLKAWSVSYLIWTEQEGLTGPNPPKIAQLLAKAERYAEVDNDDREDDDFDRYLETLQQLSLELHAYSPTTSAGVEIDSVVEFRDAYIDLAEAQYDLVQLEREAA